MKQVFFKGNISVNRNIPDLKCGELDDDDMVNYRPISSSSFISKMVKILSMQLTCLLAGGRFLLALTKT